MTLAKFLILAGLAVFAALLLAVVEARAESCSSYNATVDMMFGKGAHVDIIANDKLELEAAKAKALTGIEYVGVSRAFEISGPGGAAIGLEIGGCLLSPIWIWHGVKPTAA